MKQSEHKQIIENLIIAIQKYRSNVSEGYSGDMLEAVKEIQPITLGDNFLPILIKLGERGEISGHDFYNIMTMANINPEIRMAYDFFFPDDPLPEPNIDMAIGG